MNEKRLSRRAVLRGAAATVGGATIAVAGPAPAALAQPSRGVPAGPRIGPGDPRYPELTTGNNQRFAARPEYVRMITSTGDAERALRDALGAGKRISVRSGGHCFTDLVCNPAVEVVLDLSPMTGVTYDPARRAFAVEAGARLVNVYEALFKGWNVTIPGGVCWSVGIGGHVAGGGFGLLSRAHGLTIDHLEAVEVVVADAAGRVSTVIASRDPRDPHHDLLWAHTGAGGGNFGIVTRYWFRSPGARGADPSRQLVAPPSTVLVSAVEFPWDQLTEASFARLLMNFGDYHVRNSAPDSPTTALSSLLNVSHRASGAMGMFTQVDAATPGARSMLDDYIAAVTAGSGVTPRAATGPIADLGPTPGLLEPRELPWLQAARMVGTNNPTITDPSSRGAHKSAYMQQNFTPTQVAGLYRDMSGADFRNPDTMVVLLSYGGRVNAVPSEATASAQRTSAFKMCFQTFWPDPADDERYVGWLRATYSAFFADTGGVPVPNGVTDGCYINYADSDMADPAHNRSGVRWPELYFKANYPRLQRVKRRYDPADHFRHSLSVELPSR